MFFYSAYGLCWQSDWEIPELQEIPPQGSPDVVVRGGRVPAALDEPLLRGVFYQIQGDDFLFHLPEVLSFWVRQGKEIVMQVSQNCPSATFRSMLLGTALGALLHQRGRLILHASAVVGASGALVFAGVSGSGKSTTAAALVGRGYRLLCDDLCLLSIRSGEIWVEPAAAKLKLLPAVAEQLEWNPDLKPMRAAVAKREALVPEMFCNSSARLQRVFVLSVEHRPGTATLTTSRAVAELLRHSYRGVFLQPHQRAAHLDQITRVAAAVPVKVARRVQGERCIHRLIDDLERDLME